MAFFHEDARDTAGGGGTPNRKAPMMKPALFLLPLLLPAKLAAATLTGPASLSDAAPAPIRLDGLAPGSLVTLTMTRDLPDYGGRFSATARFKAGADGRIDTGRDAPISSGAPGNYDGIAAAGLFWSARRDAAPSPAAAADGSARIEADLGSEKLSLAIPALPQPVTTAAVAEFPGAVLARPAAASGRLPLLIVLGGSEGGRFTARTYAPLLAAQGFAVLGLPYYSPGYDPADKVAGLPTSFTEIPVDRLQAVKAWAERQSGLDASRIGLWGVSKGAEFALIAASRLAWVQAVVAVVPSDVVWEGWGRPGPATSSFSWEGKPLPFVPYLGVEQEFSRVARGERMEMRRPHVAGRAANPERVPAARIRVEEYAGALLLIGGDDDRVWPSGPMAQAVADTRAAAGRSTALLRFADAGHALAGPGTDPVGIMQANGGTLAGIAQARSTAWAATIAFLRRQLGEAGSQATKPTAR
ncbi:hypothetical protein CAP39_13395 [Sphingomonas sp. IBVSS1]|nr:hypothetical protein CAP39_13395 [Sphingomonas sp. IBVSS1]